MFFFLQICVGLQYCINVVAVVEINSIQFYSEDSTMISYRRLRTGIRRCSLLILRSTGSRYESRCIGRFRPDLLPTLRGGCSDWDPNYYSHPSHRCQERPGRI